ncbi:hypothetical protein [Streptomyces sp. NRRL S-813]|uniref:hypothetical protein n=1 Tax=Streptomyces sp. NRRL S-813 TaxID=1463919 RepID=UPI0004BEA94F|nr:hypothetical protein [Streptomyces sp. NRRL S-813]
MSEPLLSGREYVLLRTESIRFARLPARTRHTPAAAENLKDTGKGGGRPRRGTSHPSRQRHPYRSRGAVDLQ